MPLKLKLRKNCENFSRGYCIFYQTACFHEDSNSLSDYSRCYRLIPRAKKEFMHWMNDICSNCNEPVCNDCDVYINHNQ